MESNQRSGSYYSILGVGRDSSVGEIRSAYRKLAMKWHPDRWTRTPSQANEAKRRFQQIQEAYEVLSDQGKRTMYDAGLYDPYEEEDEGFSDFVQEMVSLMANVNREEKTYSLEELQGMLFEMAKGYEDLTPTWTVLEGSATSSKRLKRDTDSSVRTTPVRLSGFEMFGRSAAFVN